ncbi:Zn(II)2Cys6 transcription factor [Penicillium atrosanguineum]|nr:Zn(II)2Cys6 transcription factor [Penicillium atrosanguineum]
MTAVASAPVMSNRDSGTETGTEHSPSRFTAVNGRDSTASAAGANPTLGTQMDGEDRDAPSVANENQDASPRENPSHSQRSSPIAHAHAHKRKRSGSGDPDSQDSQDADGYGRGSIPRPGEAPPARSSSASEIEASSAAIASGRSDTNEPSQPPSSGPWSDYESRLINQAQRAQQIDASDAQLADVLQREAQGQDPRSLGRPTTSANVQPAPSSAFPERSAIQVAPKRKRVFSNRTKTGCMTCRRRKKKCDEQHPACNNCTRGGFLCEGYSTRTPWQKPSSSKAPVPLQSKEGYPEIGSQYLPEAAPSHDRPPAVIDLAESRKMKPIILDDIERPSQHAHGLGQDPVITRIWQNQLRNPITEKSLRSMSSPRDGPSKPDYQVVPPIRELSHGSHARPSMPMFQAGEHRPLPSVTMDTNSPQAQARMALGIENPLSNRAAAPADDTEKGKMTRGEYYRPFDIQLVEDRDRCKCALSRFNNACNPIYGLSSKEQNRLLKEVLVPPSNSVSSPTGPSTPRLVGSIGQGTLVESPFRCHYGWNINLEADVMVSENCLFVDDAAIQIGSNTWIGPNVTLLTACASDNLQHRRGPQTLYQAKPIIIEQDCYIGAGSTIFPGVRIGRGAVIEAGDMVKRDVAPYQLTRNRPGY